MSSEFWGARIKLVLLAAGMPRHFSEEKTMHFRRIAMLACVVALAMGGCPAQNVEDDTARLEVNVHLQAVCPYFNDREILWALHETDLSRQEGWTLEEELGSIEVACGDDWQCVDCLSEITRQVYGE